MALTVFLSSLFGLMLLGMPIAFALMLTGVALMVHLDFFDAQLVAQNMLSGADNYPLMAVPFFILAGELMNAGGISQRIINLAVSLVGHIRGGLGFVTIGASVMLASLSGSAIADTAALATLLIPMMRDHGYPVPRSAGLIASGGIIAPIIPPSMPFIIFGVTTNTSISSLFMAGIVPGLMMGAGLVLAWLWVVRGMEVKLQPKASWAERRGALVEGLWALLLPVIIIGGLRGGIFTPTEAAVVAAVYSLFVALFIYRQVAVKDLMPLFVQAARTTSTVMFLCAAALVSSYMVTLADLPQQMNEMLAPLLGHPKILMAAIALLLLAVGTVMDLTPTILVLGPVLTPLAVSAGIDPTYFGVMFVLIGTLGLIHPPVCTVLNVVCGVARISLESATRGIWPFLLTYLVLTALLIAVPEIITGPLHMFR
ncbi:TRAP transporter large permease [Azospirillum rugosum]|uniref:TRAP transporter large permease protein n=1 Tax=Azospirillum rugosum TaxID=416170 RepID=A0ABS4SQ20_9PROT|nr:TRAP transporter large permease subunit [Azospirillum rugosum]MBP2294552.1 tripartite ATP-independent transporter DctM subunit [Azospirillum rugosum]MDQ0524660.1 tripartite ATP-independent transporter DctM subunit [Azospirillum rugosum]